MKSKSLLRILLILLLSSVLIKTTNAQSTNFGYTGMIVTYTIPVTGDYQFTAAGGIGGGAVGNVGDAGGAVIGGDIRLSAGTVINIAVGQSGEVNYSGGGGGGTFVYLLTNSPLIIAGGGGGGGYISEGTPGLTNTGGTGLGGSAEIGAGGAGFYGNGSNSYLGATGGLKPTNFTGGSGGSDNPAYITNAGRGGYGGGGGGGFDTSLSQNGFSGGGGGGYTGGSGGTNGLGGAGGTSYISGSFSNVFGNNGANLGDGYVSITRLVPTFYWASGSNSWSLSSNWSGIQVPVSSNNAYIDNGGTAILTNAGTVGNLTIASTFGSSGTLLISNGGTLTVSTNLIVGYAGTGTLTIGQGGTLVDPSIIMASIAGANGVLNIGSYGGHDTNVHLTMQSIAGGVGLGVVNFNQADTLTFGSTLSLTGALGIKQLGSGTTIYNGVNISNIGSLTVDAGAVVFNGGTFTNSSITVGDSETADPLNNGTLRVTNGAKLTTGTLWFGYSDYSSVNNFSLIISAGSSLVATDAFNGTAAWGEGPATNNRILVTGAGAYLGNAAKVYLGDGWGVGYSSVGNSLTISNGGNATLATNLYVGEVAGDSNNTITIYGNSTLTVAGSSSIGVSGSFNSVFVSGSNAIWTNKGDITLGSGSGGSGNTLVISGGGKVFGNNLWIGYGYADQSNNSVLITGPGSTLISSNYVDVGYYGAGPNESLVVSNGGRLVSVTGVVGEALGATNNYVTLTGAGSTWSNSGTITIGADSGGVGAVNIQTGATLISSNITIASDPDSLGVLNVGTYGGNDTKVSLKAQTINFGQGTGTVFFNQADTITNNSVFSGGYATNLFQSSIVQNGQGTTVLTGQSVASNTIGIYVVSGGLVLSGAVFDNSDPDYACPIYVGNLFPDGSLYSTGTNSGSLKITSGSAISTYDLEIGIGENYTYPGGPIFANNNSGVIQGSNTTVSTFNLNVGDWGNSNTLTVLGGSTVTEGGGGLIIGNPGSWNVMTISGSNTVVDASAGGIYIGGYSSNYSGNFNKLIISNGASVYGDYDVVGGVNGNYNKLIITGPGSTYTNFGDLNVGNGDGGSGSSVGNSMIVSNNATVSINGNVNVGNATGDDSNSLMVYGNSTLTVAGVTDIGAGGSYNSSTVSGSNALWTNGSTLYIGGGIGSVGNTVLITSNAFAQIGGNIYIGDHADGNSFVVSAGANLVAPGDVTVGFFANQSSLSFSNGAIGSLGAIYLGYGFGGVGGNGNSNTMTVSGSTVNLNGNDLAMGYYGIGNRLNVLNGGSLSARALYVGDDGFGNTFSNSVNVSGGSTINLSDTITIGYQSYSNMVTVSGSNSTIIVGGRYSYLGEETDGNSLVISNSGKVLITNGALYVGYYGSSNTVKVTGAGSKLSNAGLIDVGGGSNALILDNGGHVVVGSALIESGGILTGNGTLSLTGAGTATISGSFAPTGTNALTVNGNLTFTGGTYLWNLFNNSTSTTGGTNFTVPVVLNGNLLVDTNSSFDLTFGGSVNQGSPFWTNNQQWQVIAGTNSLFQGTNFTLAWSSPNASAGFDLSMFSLTNTGNNLYLVYTAPLITNPVVDPGSTNYLPSYSNSRTVLIITAPTNGTAVLAGTNPTLSSITVDSGTLNSTNQNSIPTNASVTVNNGKMGFTGPGTNSIGSLLVNGGIVAASNTTISVASYTQTGGSVSGGSNVTYWAANYYFAATNRASVDASLDNLGTVANYHSTAIVTTNANGSPVAPVVFQNSMSYDGGTVITKGILQLGDSNNTGPISVQGVITNNGFLNYGYNGNSTTPTNLVIGSGVIGQVGTGTLTVGSVGVDSQFTGSFAAANGTLAITTNSALGSSTNYYLASGGTLQAMTGVTNFTNVNVTNGTGVIENASGGTLALNGTLTKSGTVLVLNGGNITVNAQITGSGAPGSFDSDLVIDNANVSLFNSNNNYSGPTYVIGGGTVTNRVANALPTNTVLIMGTNNDSGFNIYDINGYNQTIAGLSSLPFTTSTEIVTNSGGSSVLTLNGATNTLFSGTIAGNLVLVRSGVGSTMLTGSNSYSGGTTITSGKLITANNSALGTGTVSLLGGTLQVNSILTISALVWNHSTATGSMIALPNAHGTNDYVAVTTSLTLGSAKSYFNLSGVHLSLSPTELLAFPGVVTPGNRVRPDSLPTYTTNEFGVVGVSNYSLLISNNALWIEALNSPVPPVPPAPAYPNFVIPGLTYNQNQVARALNVWASNNPYGDKMNVLSALTNILSSKWAAAYDQMSPRFYQQMATISFNLANAQYNELVQRLYGLRVAGSGFSMTGFDENTAMPQENPGKSVVDPKKDILRPGLDNRWGMFVDGNGIFANANSANMLPGYNFESGGITTGMTYKWNDSVGTGIYAGYQGAYSKNNGLGTLIDNAVKFGLFGAYGTPDGKGLYADGLIGGGYNNYQNSRSIEFGSITRTANSSPGAGELDSMLAAGYNWRKGNWSFGPVGSMQYTYFGVNGFGETGAQSLNLNNQGWNASSMLSSVGANCAYSWEANRNLMVVPQINLAWQHEFLQNPYAINSSMGGTPYSNWSAVPNRDTLYTGVGVTLEYKKTWNTAFFYNAAAGNQNITSQNIFWSAGVKF